MDIKATIGQLTAERDKLDKAIQALQALEEVILPGTSGNRSPLPHARAGRRAEPSPLTVRGRQQGAYAREGRQTRHHQRRCRVGDPRKDWRQR